jgi:hypothetical protein
LEVNELKHIFQQAMLMNRTAFSGEEFDVAYHMLMAALHSAQQLESVEFLREVEELAVEQLTYIDKHQPGYSHSTASASVRQQRSIFDTAAQQAKARILILERKKA